MNPNTKFYISMYRSMKVRDGSGLKIGSVHHFRFCTCAILSIAFNIEGNFVPAFYLVAIH